ncbi:polysaccharide pyruvyl transferase family protein [Mobilicoccus sp.]|uniref:polysaccharide pyruvyl transferase family protein n=1 Tax=Mobilicoccus sp. TaxID=2034349 RepID=UPI00289AED48|nr:polysaccharide pyruvyl transferase family protein [Mobilicoccus sp.]
MTTVIDALTTARDSGRRVHYRPELGNAGDALINVGFYHLADRLGLTYREITGGRFDLDGVLPGDLVICAGGGSISSVWDIGARTLEALTRGDHDLLLLPQTIEGQEEALSLLRPRDLLFVRERRSLAHAVATGVKARIMLDHDMAFHLDPTLARKGMLLRPPARPDDLRRAAAFARHRARGLAGETLEAWRTDDERSDAARTRRRRDDLSLLADRGTLDRASNERSAALLMSVVSWYRQVRTDRLHIGIAAALLGKPVTLSPGSYHKIRSVYEFSMKNDPRFAHVTYENDPQTLAAVSAQAAAAAAAATAGLAATAAGETEDHDGSERRAW